MQKFDPREPPSLGHLDEVTILSKNSKNLKMITTCNLGLQFHVKTNLNIEIDYKFQLQPSI